ncbi:hypothetical protein [Prochlorococcus marinus]|uniref:Uncharacterized protein n=1 Tax=Prochlorococcus marinus (strain MIT 9211) TaxID=93059 RepID=A9BAU7_PROM4|nr:hypothetical protein [Prochlorococcus marinus]ABX08959.1 Hypothetical protein P9211_10281 [Prochlorococcus marinus str. MIT 9211]
MNKFNKRVNKFSLLLKFTLIIIPLFFISTNLIRIRKENIIEREVMDRFIEFNLSLEKIENYIETEDWPNTCKEAVKASYLIKENYLVFKKKEPYYDWKEIQNLLEVIPRKFCKS